jgi:hypothetical protein
MCAYLQPGEDKQPVSNPLFLTPPSQSIPFTTILSLDSTGFRQQVLDASKVRSAKNSRPYSTLLSISKFLFIVFIMKTNLRFASNGLLFAPTAYGYCTFSVSFTYPYT